MPSRRLRTSSSARTSSAKLDAHRGARVRRRAPSAAARSPGCLTTSCASRSASAWLSSGSSRSMAEVAKVEVVDDLGDQLVEALDQRHAGVGVACHPERLAAPAGRTGGWWRWSRRRTRPARRAAVGDARGVRPRCRRAGARSPGCRRPGWIVESRDRVDDLAPDPSRSSWLAARPNVISSIWSRVASPSATYRVTRPASANVLPVPALASSTVVDRSAGSGPSRSNVSIIALRRSQHRQPQPARAYVVEASRRRGPFSHAPLPQARTCAWSASSPG